jgi:DNA polymerase-3 subunit gamma/tau
MALGCTGTGPKPCGLCPSCLEIQTGQAVDVIEVDGASNRGINEIRGLRETVKFLPAKNPYKVYIIDEVHALTTDAFNALLKTLEEPPSHVVFIFATTEAHKLPATILSRCQRYDFRRIRIEDIVSRLTQVAKEESISVSKEALTVIARQAEGGLRDALGLMDQVIASGGEITLEAVNSALGLINQDLVRRTAVSALEGNPASSLKVLDEAYNLGYDFKELGLKALELVRDLTLYKASPATGELMELTDAEEADFKEITAKVTLPTLHRHFETWLKFYGELTRHPQPRWLMEAHLIRLCQLAPLADLANLAERLTAFLEGNFSPAASPTIPQRSLNAPLAANIAAPLEQPRAAETVETAAIKKAAADLGRSPAPGSAVFPETAKAPESAETPESSKLQVRRRTPAPSGVSQTTQVEPQKAVQSFEEKASADRQTADKSLELPSSGVDSSEADSYSENVNSSESKSIETFSAPDAASITSNDPISAAEDSTPLAFKSPSENENSSPINPQSITAPETVLAPDAVTAQVDPVTSQDSEVFSPSLGSLDALCEMPELQSAATATLSNAELIERLSAAPFIENRMSILGELPTIQRLKEKIPGKFVGYFDLPAAERNQDNGNSEEKTEQASSEPEAETAEPVEE